MPASVDCYDSYDTNESGMMAQDCEFKNGMHINEDARDEMTVMVEVSDAADRDALKGDLEHRLKEVIGLRVTVTTHAPGELDQHTGTSQISKIKRLLDKRRQE